MEGFGIIATLENAGQLYTSAGTMHNVANKPKLAKSELAVALNNTVLKLIQISEQSYHRKP